MTSPAQPAQAQRPVVVWTLGRILLAVGCALFVIASLCAGGVITGWSTWAFAFGGFAAWCLSGAVP